MNKTAVLLFLLILETTAITGAEMAAPFYRIACLIYDVGLNTIGALAVLMFLYGGIRWITSETPETRLLAKHILTYALIGIIFFTVIKGFVYVVIPEAGDICS